MVGVISPCSQLPWMCRKLGRRGAHTHETQKARQPHNTIGIRKMGGGVKFRGQNTWVRFSRRVCWSCFQPFRSSSLGLRMFVGVPESSPEVAAFSLNPGSLQLSLNGSVLPYASSWVVSKWRREGHTNTHNVHKATSDFTGLPQTSSWDPHYTPILAETSSLTPVNICIFQTELCTE